MKIIETVSLTPSVHSLLLAHYGEAFNVGNLLNAIRAAEGRMQLDENGTPKRSATSYTKRKDEANSYIRSGQTERQTFIGDANDVALKFLAWHDDITKLEKKYGTETIGSFPFQFRAWLGKFASVKATEAKTEAVNA